MNYLNNITEVLENDSRMGGWEIVEYLYGVSIKNSIDVFKVNYVKTGEHLYMSYDEDGCVYKSNSLRRIMVKVKKYLDIEVKKDDNV